MKIAVLGAGALGSIIAGQLARTGEDVILLARGARAKLLAEQGITIRGISEVTVPVQILTDHTQLRDAGLLINTVKTYDSDAALAPLRQAKISAALSLQNGVLKDEQIAAVFGHAATLGAVADFSGEVLSDGAALWTRNVGIYVGELPSGISPRVEAIIETLQAAGIRAEASEKIETLTWSKYAAWMGLTSASVLSRLYTHQMLQDDELSALVVTMAREAVGLATTLGIEVEDMGGALVAKTLAGLPFDEAVAYVQRVGDEFEAAGVTTHKMSALQDAERSRRLEVEETLGYAVRRGKETGVAMPATEVCYRLLTDLNDSFEPA